MKMPNDFDEDFIEKEPRTIFEEIGCVVDSLCAFGLGAKKSVKSWTPIGILCSPEDDLPELSRIAVAENRGSYLTGRAAGAVLSVGIDFGLLYGAVEAANLVLDYLF